MHDPHTASIFMVADMTGSVSLHQRLNEQEAERVIDRGLKRMTRSIEGQGGKVQQVVGDELLARFTQAEAACHAAIDMQQRVADLPPVSGHKLSLRVALATAADAAQGESQHITQALRLAALGTAGEILCDATLGKMLCENNGLHFMPCTGRQISCDASPGSAGVSPFQLLWSNTGGNTQLSEASEPPPAFDQASRLCLRYLGQTYLVSLQNPVLTTGRDASCGVIVDDRRVSRQHARIERRSDGFYLVDTSTNGSFVSIQGRQEALVRKHDVLLEGRGKICLGSTINDGRSECLEFEHL